MRSVLVPLALPAMLALVGCPGSSNGTDLPEGCITVNGSAGFQFLSDAMTIVQDGDTVQLCNEITDTLVIDKTITFESAFTMDGAYTSLWRPPDNEPAMRIVEGGDVTLDGLYITTSRNGITVEEGGLLDISRTYIEVDNPGSYGIEIDRGTVIADGLIVNQAFWGAIQNTGGTLTLTNSDLVNSFRWGVRLDDGATADIRDTRIAGTRIRDETGEFNDGWGVYVCADCRVTMDNVDLQSNVLGGLYVDLGIAEVTGGTWDGNFISAWIEGGTATFDDVDIINPIQYGVLARSSTVDMTDVRIDGDPENGRFEDLSTPNLEGTYGVLVFDGAMTWAGGGARELTGGGVFAQGNQAAQLPLIFSDLSIADNSALGIQVALTDLQTDNVKITGTRSLPDICEADGTYSCDWALAAFQSDVDWIGGSIRDNEGMGAIVRDGPSDFTGLELANNQAFGLWGIQAVINLTGGDVHGIGDVAVAAMDGSFVTIDDTDVHDRDFTSSFTSNEFEYRTGLAAAEVEAFDSTVEISNSRFRNGNNGVFGYAGSFITVTDTTFDGYNRFGVQVSNSTLEVDRVDFAGFGGDVIVCSGASDVNIQRTSITGVAKVQSVFETWQNGALANSSRTEIGLPAVRGTGCTLEASRLSLSGLEGQAIDLAESTVDELDRITVNGANLNVGDTRTPEPVIDLAWSTSVPEANVSDVEITNVPVGTGLRLTSSTVVPEGGTSEVRLSEIQVGDATGHGGVGIDLSGLIDVELSEFSTQNTAAEGLIVRNSAGRIGTDEGPSSVVMAGGDGVLLDTSTVTLSDVTVSTAAASGVRVTGGSPILAGVQIAGAGGYGMSCVTDPEVPVCTDVTAVGALGQHDGCGACFSVVE